MTVTEIISHHPGFRICTVGFGLNRDTTSWVTAKIFLAGVLPDKFLSTFTDFC
jgi:hypothetical protein